MSRVQKLAIIVLNQVIIPFFAKWYKESLSGAFDDENKRQSFRDEFGNIQVELGKNTRLLGDMAGVEEDLSELEDDEKNK